MKLDSVLLSFMGRQVPVLFPESGHLGLTEDEDFHLHHELKCGHQDQTPSADE